MVGKGETDGQTDWWPRKRNAAEVKPIGSRFWPQQTIVGQAEKNTKKNS